MTLKEIKIKLLENNMTMTEFSKEIGVKRENLYYKIRVQDPEIIEKISSLLFSNCN